MRLKRSFIPSIFTIFNMFAGFLAILQIHQGHIVTAVVLILAAMVFDSLDGKVARWLQQQSDFGVEFDSLADIISFCLVPSLMVYTLYVSDMGIIGAMIGFFPLLFGGVRLARFNLSATPQKKDYFTGLPVPAMAVTIASFVWFNKSVFGHTGDPKLALSLVLVLSFMMVSNIRFSSTFHITFRNGPFGTFRSIFILLSSIIVIIFRGYAIFPVMCIFIITHILAWIVGYEEPRTHFSMRRKVK